MISDFNQAVNFIRSYIPDPSRRYPGKTGLDRMRKLLSYLKNPHKRYPVIHIAGTSGKGSTATMISSILSEQYRVGLHTSPHLIDIRERMMIGRKMISKKRFVDLINVVIPGIGAIEKTSLGRPSYFEILTAMAFVFFSQEQVDIAVIETGMGGRWDGTNVVTPLVSVITTVGLDHTDVLGHTVEQIAEEKAGIIKPGVPVVSGVTQPSIIAVLERNCALHHAPLRLLHRDFGFRVRMMTVSRTAFDYSGINPMSVSLPIPGAHQAGNAAVAIRTIEELMDRNPRGLFGGFLNNSIQNGLRNIRIPGRMEIISRRPLIMLDGAHNGDKAEALAKGLQTLFGKKKIITVIAVKSDKMLTPILRPLCRITDRFIITQVPMTTDTGMMMSFDPQKMVRLLHRLCVSKNISIVTPVESAWKSALETVEDDGMILVTGSLYLVGIIKQIMRQP